MISVVKDGQYGSSNDFVNSVWDGLIGEITRKVRYLDYVKQLERVHYIQFLNNIHEPDLSVLG